MITDHDRSSQAVDTVIGYIKGLIAQDVSRSDAIAHATHRFGVAPWKRHALLKDAER